MTEREGGKDRKIELGLRDCGRDTGKHKNTDISRRKTTHFNITTAIFRRLQFLFYRNKIREVTAMRRVATVIFCVD